MMTMHDFLKTLTTKTLERLGDELARDVRTMFRHEEQFDMWTKSVDTRSEINVILHLRRKRNNESYG